MSIPQLPTELTETNWKTKVLPKVKGKWKGEAGMTMISTCLRSLDAKLMGALTNFGSSATVTELKKALHVTKVNLEKLQQTLEKDKKDLAAAELLKIIKQMKESIKNFKPNIWDKFLTTLNFVNINAIPGFKQNFYKFAKNEYSEESIEYVQLATKVSKNPQALLALYEKYIKERSPREVNISYKSRKSWEQPMAVIEAFVRPKTDEVGVDKLQAMEACSEVMVLKAQACKELDTLAKDIFTRFRNELSL